MIDATWNVLVGVTCVWAAIVGTLIGRDLWRWFWSDDKEDE
jgi:hypothetical protein